MKFSSTVFNRVVTTSALAAAVAVAPLMSAMAQQQVTLNGAGATFPQPLYERYAREVGKKVPGLRVNYQGIGSGGGIRQFIAGTVDFGASDAAMKDSEIAQVKRGVIMVPTAGGAVSVVFNVPGVSNLKLSRKTLPAIFAGQITNWSDAQIKADNPGVNLPNLPIRPVVRADGSGTTFIFTNHLSAISAYFKGRIGANTAPKWTLPSALKGKGNPGVAGLVRSTQGSIGYVEYSYAISNRIASAQIQNKQGKYVAPNLQTSNQALDDAKFPDNFRIFIGDPGDGYPIVGMTWMLVYRTGYGAKAEPMKKWLNFVLREGQNFNDDLNYVKVPGSVVNRVLQQVNTIK